jgi:hypothetical protein
MIDASKSKGRVRRDNLDEPYWVERFMFARRVGLSDGRDRTSDPSSRPSDRRATARRIIERIAGELFKRPI